MSYGYAESIYNSISEAAMNAVSTGVVTSAIFLFPVGCSLAQVIMGFISDSKGRKVAALVTAFDCLVCFVGFWLGAKYNWHPAIVGLLCGGFVGSFYSTNDVLIMMIGESAPTNLRSSVMAAEFLPVGIGVGISYIIYFPLSAILGNQFIGIISICMLVPGFVAALITLAKKTHDTKGINLDTVTGAEWD
jgi:MFS family permease